ncbi:glycosyltransferase family A protein [Winogradskyella maritima]|uniref:Glycosyltransferase family 2 protein n=1 Tax=Winogradskyella maritima TaxID=1517766 RepID=A0ABV8AHG9_9FLAO|nr:glycosyltransferase family A protein [Winogradskyella maritima]
MLFKLYSYIQPIHYFELYRKDGTSIFPTEQTLKINGLIPSKEVSNQPQPLGQQYSLAFQAIKTGLISEATTLTAVKELTLLEEYTFLRTQVNRLWVGYVLLLRLLALKNPLKELRAVYQTRHTKKKPVIGNGESHKAYRAFKSDLINQQPLVSVIIPTLNRYPYLKDVLTDLEQQEYQNIEVLIVDQSDAFDQEFYKDYKLNINLTYQKEKALWRARNTAIRKAKGEYLLFFDDDSRVDTDWVSEHLKTLDYFKADISSGVSISKVGDKVPAHYAYFKISEQLDTGNAMIKRSVFKQIGLFDRQFEKMRMGDGEFGCRAFVAGLKNVSNPKAKRLHLKVGQGGLRAMGSWDAFRTKYLWQPRPIPSVLYYFRRYYGTKRSLLAIVKTVPLAIMPYRFKGSAKATGLGLVLLLFIWPLVLFQVMRSWRMASKMLATGPKIEQL